MIFRFVLAIAILAALFTSACQNKSSNETAGSAPNAGATTATPTPGASPSPSTTLPPLPAKFAEVTFTDVTSQAGIRFKHNNGAFGKKYLPETNGSGCAFLDYDNDGWQDILLVNSTSFADAPKKINSVMALYHNNQNGTFTDVTRAAGLAKPIYGQGVTVGDYDNDGFVDIFVTALGQSRLFRNNGNGKFTDVTAKAGLTSPGYFSSSAAFFDYDSDGWPDIFVANDTQPNKLYKNNGGKGTFTESALTAGVALSEEGKARGGMGTDFADIDGSGNPSIIVGNFSNDMLALFRNQGKGLFIDQAPSSNVGQATMLSLTFGLFFFDYDLDGRPDFFMANGHVADDINKVQPKITYAMKPQLFRGEGKAKFTETTSRAGRPFQRAVVGRGAAYGDYDNDGDLDVLLTTNGGPAYLLRNDNGNQARFARFKAVGDKSNRDGIGAKITVTLTDGAKQWQTVHSGSSYCSQSELPLTFGLSRSDKIARVEIDWPSGKVDKLTDLTANQLYVVKEGAGVSESKPLPLPQPTPSPSPTVGN